MAADNTKGTLARMAQATPAHSETTLATGHTPFLTNPAGVVKAIEDAAR